MGERIAALLEERGWTQTEFARRLGCTRAAVSRWVSGEDPSLAMLRRIAAVLGVPEGDLFPPARTRRARATG